MYRRCVISAALGGCLMMDHSGDGMPNFQQAAQVPKEILAAAAQCSAWGSHLSCFLTKHITQLRAVGCFSARSVLAELIWCPFALLQAIAESYLMTSNVKHTPSFSGVQHAPLAPECLKGSSWINYTFVLYYLEIIENTFTRLTSQNRNCTWTSLDWQTASLSL